MRAIFGAAIALTLLAPASHAQDTGFLGFGYQISNDFIGDAMTDGARDRRKPA